MVTPTVKPIVNGCYVDSDLEMYKVRMVSYDDTDPTSVLIEGTDGMLRRVGVDTWNEMHLIPCCLGSDAKPREQSHRGRRTP